MTVFNSWQYFYKNIKAQSVEFVNYYVYTLNKFILSALYYIYLWVKVSI